MKHDCLFIVYYMSFCPTFLKVFNENKRNRDKMTIHVFLNIDVVEMHAK